MPKIVPPIILEEWYEIIPTSSRDIINSANIVRRNE